MPILELCAGYGGLGMAVEALTGDKVVYVADNDEAASLVLAHHWPDVPNIGDITVYDWQQLVGLVDIVAAGFSCQDISVAGPREGISGSRSRIWKDVAKAVGVLRPRLVFLENVANIKSRGLDVVAEDVAAVGYDLWWTCLRASAAPVGAAHQRDRWFAVGVPHAEGIGRSARRTEPAEQQGEVRRPSGDGRQSLARPAGPEDTHIPAGAQWGSAASGQEERGGHGPTLDDEVSFLLPYADSGGRYWRAGNEPEEDRGGEPANSGHSPAKWWGDYLPAIRRWERLTEVAAPAPTEIGPRGGRRLTASFAEWLMGIPGHVTGVPGLTRAQQLARIGNGAMPQQSYVAYEYLLQQIKGAPWQSGVKSTP